MSIQTAHERKVRVGNRRGLASKNGRGLQSNLLLPNLRATLSRCAIHAPAAGFEQPVLLSSKKLKTTLTGSVTVHLQIAVLDLTLA